MGNSKGYLAGKSPAQGDQRSALSPPALPAYVSAGWTGGLLLVPALLIAAAVTALTVDVFVARWCVEHDCPRLAARLLDVVEPFGNGLGVLLAVLLVYQLDPARRWALPRLLAMSIGAGLAADLVKMVIVRIRPHNFDFQGSVADTFGQWLPLASAGSGGQSFPSAHTATAVGLAVALIWLYPRGRWLFIALAGLVGCQRVAAGAHYLSDTLCGAAIGCLVATACLRGLPLAVWFGHLEHRLRAGRQAAPECVILPVRDGRPTPHSADKQTRTHAA